MKVSTPNTEGKLLHHAFFCRVWSGYLHQPKTMIPLTTKSLLIISPCVAEKNEKKNMFIVCVTMHCDESNL